MLGSYCALVVFALLLILIFWVAVDPIGAGQMDGNARAVNFFQAYLTMPVILLFFGLCKLYYRTSVVGNTSMNLSIGGLRLTLEHIREEERAKRRKLPWYRVLYARVRGRRFWAQADDTEMDWGFRQADESK